MIETVTAELMQYYTARLSKINREISRLLSLPTPQMEISDALPEENASGQHYFDQSKHASVLKIRHEYNDYVDGSRQDVLAHEATHAWLLEYNHKVSEPNVEKMISYLERFRERSDVERVMRYVESGIIFQEIVCRYVGIKHFGLRSGLDPDVEIAKVQFCLLNNNKLNILEEYEKSGELNVEELYKYLLNHRKNRAKIGYLWGVALANAHAVIDVKALFFMDPEELFQVIEKLSLTQDEETVTSLGTLFAEELKHTDSYKSKAKEDVRDKLG